jgi:protein translocase SEC61 complex gamma subunit
LISNRTKTTVDKINITFLIFISVSNYPKYEKYSTAERQKKPGLFVRLGNFFQSARRILKVANKPNRKDYFTVFKICGIGTVILGALSFVIQLIFSVALPIG